MQPPRNSGEKKQSCSPSAIKFPSLTVPVQQGGALPAGETLDLGETHGKWKILFYWPKDFTFVCPTEIIGYGELARDFADRDAVLIGASTDSDFVHHAWRKADERLAACDFPWIADNKKELAEALGIVAPDAESPSAPPSSSIPTMSSSTSR